MPAEIAVGDAAARLDYRGTGAAAFPRRVLVADVPWWSFTKTLIAAACLRLAEDGRFDLDRPREPHPVKAFPRSL